MEPKRRRRRPSFHAPEIWRLTREAYLAGATAPECEERFGVRENALRRRAVQEGWTRRAHYGGAMARTPTLPSPAPAAAISEPDAYNPLDICDATLREAMKALARGDAREASALIKAGDAIGEFADFVRGKKKQQQERETIGSGEFSGPDF